MISNVLFLLGFIVLLISYLKIVVIYLRVRKDVIGDITGFDVAKEITANYDEINIVESKKIFFSQYNLKRGIIRLVPHNYEDNSVFSLAVVAQLSGYSLGSLDNNYYYRMISKVFPAIDWFNKSGLIATLICYFTNSIGDAKIGLFLLFLILVYQYFILQMNTIGISYLEDYLKDSDKKRLSKVLDTFNFLHKSSFIVTLIYILKEIVIVLGL